LRPAVIVVALCACLGSFSRARALDGALPAGWSEASRNKEMILFYKDNDKAKARAFQAIGEANAPPASVYAAVTDVEAHTKILKHLNDLEVIAYQVISPPMIAERDSCLHIKLTPGSAATGDVWRSEWNEVSECPAEKPGLVRLPVAEGTWLFEPLDGGKRTRITYTALTSIGGSVPGWIANMSTTSIIPKIFEAVKKRVSDLAAAAPAPKP
jgi:hypothetical protein